MAFGKDQPVAVGPFRIGRVMFHCAAEVQRDQNLNCGQAIRPGARFRPP